ncbi:TolC family protein [Mucilaginibacter sp. SG564]|uniref:TolC family protein n=1 Tax=Mucilaginibacter sp. SG564 TaxID=2587022 RepID=UPI0015568DD8|nr:efflux transporter outer membrane subunit [Mucilaginibacter sp. SG564]NOW96031.1 NodT family efflux transporter outer membrane factor (OMF) lipoprotein [Mucilaginibacter sp. SG564]
MKTLKFGWLALITLAILSGCKVSKDTQLPDMQLKNYRAATVEDTASVGRLSWKNFFTDPTLRSLIDSAILRNNDLQIAVKNIESSRQLLTQAKWGNVPVVGLGVSAATNNPSDNSFTGLSLNSALQTNHINDYNAGLNLSWEADIWGKISSRKAAALSAYLQTEEARKAVQIRLISNVASGYYNLLMLDEQIEIAKANVRLNDSTISIIKLQFTSGQTTSLAVQQAEAQRLTAAALVPKFEQAIAIQENALSILAGKLPEAVTRSGKLENIALPKNLSAGVPSQLLTYRPDVRSAELAVDKANAQVGYSKAAMYPTLAITAQGGVNSFKASNWFTLPASLFGVVTGSVVQPLLQRRELKTNYEVAKINREKSVIEFRQQVLTAVGEVSDQLVAFDKLGEQKIIVSNRAKTLQQATNNANALFKNGLANYLEVITAQSNVLQSELELAGIRKAQLIAAVDLYRSLGGGWN